MKFSPVVNEKLSDKVVKVITEQIKSGQLKPGDKLPSEPELANELQVSRGILREALTALQARNIIYRKPKEGTFITANAPDMLIENWEISMKNATYLDLIEVRECIESRIVEKVIDTITGEQIQELYDLIQMKNTETEHSADYYFHFRLAELSHNMIFASFIDNYYYIFNEITAISSQRISRRKGIVDEHTAIVDAIREKDKKKARQCVRHHLQMVRESVIANEQAIREENGAKTR